MKQHPNWHLYKDWIMYLTPAKTLSKSGIYWHGQQKQKYCGISKISSQPPRTGSGGTAADALEPFTENVQKAFPAQSLHIVPIYTGKSVHKVNL